MANLLGNNKRILPHFIIRLACPRFYYVVGKVGDQAKQFFTVKGCLKIIFWKQQWQYTYEVNLFAFIFLST